MTVIGNFVGGRFTEAGGDRFDKVNPADGALVARVVEAHPAAPDGAWGRASGPAGRALNYAIRKLLGVVAVIVHSLHSYTRPTNVCVAL